MLQSGFLAAAGEEYSFLASGFIVLSSKVFANGSH